MGAAQSDHRVTPIVEGESPATVDAGTVHIHGSGEDDVETDVGDIGLDGERATATIGRLARTKRVRTG